MRTRYLPLVLLSIAGALGAEPARDRHGDALPEGAVARLGRAGLRGQQVIVSATFSPDGKLLATADLGSSITCWDPATGKEVRRLPVPCRRALAVRFGADGKSLLVGGPGGAFRVLDAVTGAERRKLDADTLTILTLDVNPDGKTAVTINVRGTAAVWDVAGGRRLREFEGLPTSGAFTHHEMVALTPDGKQLVLPRADGSLRLADVASGKEVLSVEMPPAVPPAEAARRGIPKVWFHRVVVSPDGRYLAHASWHTGAALCDLKTGKRVRAIAPTLTNVNGVAFSPDGRSLALSTSGKVHLCDVRSGKELRTITLAGNEARHNLCFSPDGKTLAGFGNGPVLELWDVSTGRPLHAPAGHRGPICALAFFADGKRLASAASANGEDLIVWDVAAGRDLARLRGVYVFSHTMGLVGEGERVQFLGGDGAVHRWDLRAGRDERLPLPPRPDAHIHTLSPDGRSIAGVTHKDTRRVKVQDLRGDRAPRILELPNNILTQLPLVFSPDGRLLAAAGSSGGPRVWDRDTGKRVRELDVNGPTGCLAFSADGRCLAVAGVGMRLIELATGEARLAATPPERVNALACSPDGRFVASGQGNGDVVVYGTATGKQLAHWKGGQGYVRNLAFSRDGRLLASGGEDGTILVWKLPAAEAIPVTLKAEEVEALWQALGGDAPGASRALAGLAAAPADAVPFLRRHIPSATRPPDAATLARLIADLDDDRFRVRERASRELAAAGPDAVGALRAALADNPSAESRKRIEELLRRLGKEGDSRRLRCLRGIEALERVGTPAAKEALRELADRPLPAEARAEVRASLRRMGDRP